MKTKDFYVFRLDIDDNIFELLTNLIELEDINKGRKGGVLVKSEERGIPIVRKTTNYKNPASHFTQIHNTIIEKLNKQIQQETKIKPFEFNNALIEVYDREYYKMGYHSDLDMDLEDDSFIALFSCYENASNLSTNALRKLKIKSKATSEEFEISLPNNSLILFSLKTNREFVHKIILDISKNEITKFGTNRWLGLTYQKSKTFIKFKNGLPFLTNGNLLRVANDEEREAFYKLKKQENEVVNFNYPEINYTLSIGDTLEPILV
ncbi:alpha-ketoglutarate-dependent dioxygenase AlkB [Nostoc sp. FACHB-87]|uniref:alpha-ketoglutarate-dependent dioxygenase AlkB n=1 Tax=Nostocales TaxID=1161 RepID=UPI0016864AEA|nr:MULTISPECIES: alpha-ketoglutarate-dependent dioxygenase AlkB [Nostocales]MBD2214809.1 alpha-ketoglutarate-dependent dioxygenase AlkB [Nostoc linckia FACHB-104]MBD2303710.1 alpha-ketoglutarate-dependent dioxygenase AlkB [Nostoc sp. FACHB-190]MBD2459291.1 alpha-ketoglutarate-dependent dioxygenase AlkB [Nostoc sp. FACHB-87]MBD2480306.1 alpha-ketoglutarate-dependent dioxygenase AlkB [Anabaena sp. FACHB-83]MBD2491830.1 alpha-ketoglutarate-dependent dioxygenase AlkB [Aulosira sp. FACHB-615]